MSLFIVEGVTMYLDEQQNQKTLNLSYELMEHPGSELLDKLCGRFSAKIKYWRYRTKGIR